MPSAWPVCADFLEHVGPVFPQTGQRLVRDLEVTVVELGKDFLVLGVGDTSDAAVGRAHCEKLVGVVGREGRPLSRVSLAAT